MSTKSREHLYGTTIRMSAERAKEARKVADRLACEAWNYRMLGYKGPAQPSPTLGDALNAGYLYLEVRCLGCNTSRTVALDIVRRPKATPVHELERYSAARTARISEAIPTNAVVWLLCAGRRFQRVIRRQRGGRGSDKTHCLGLQDKVKYHNHC
jgi:hypothetical protein